MKALHLGLEAARTRVCRPIVRATPGGDPLVREPTQEPGYAAVSVASGASTLSRPRLLSTATPSPRRATNVLRPHRVPPTPGQPRRD